jgi:hypothetical protein
MEYNWSNACELRAITVRGRLTTEAILRGIKRVENRTRPLHPGWYGLHLGANQSKSADSVFQAKLAAAGYELTADDARRLPYGTIVGALRIVGVEKDSHDPFADPLPMKANVIGEVIRFDTPIKDVKGFLGGWKVVSFNKSQVAEAVLDQIRAN